MKVKIQNSNSDNIVELVVIAETPQEQAILSQINAVEDLGAFTYAIDSTVAGDNGIKKLIIGKTV